MAMQKIEAYRCSYCGKIVLHPDMHEFECKHDPKSRTCTTCGFSAELKCSTDDGLSRVRYCPRAEKLFEYPCRKYCPDYKRSPAFSDGGDSNA